MTARRSFPMYNEGDLGGSFDRNRTRHSHNLLRGSSLPKAAASCASVALAGKFADIVVRSFQKVWARSVVQSALVGGEGTQTSAKCEIRCV